MTYGVSYYRANGTLLLIGFWNQVGILQNMNG